LKTDYTHTWTLLWRSFCPCLHWLLMYLRVCNIVFGWMDRT